MDRIHDTLWDLVEVAREELSGPVEPSDSLLLSGLLSRLRQDVQIARVWLAIEGPHVRRLAGTVAVRQLFFSRPKDDPDPVVCETWAQRTVALAAGSEGILSAKGRARERFHAFRQVLNWNVRWEEDVVRVQVELLRWMSGVADSDFEWSEYLARYRS